MTRIVLATASADLEARFHAATGGAFLALPPAPLPNDPAHLFALLNGAPPPDVVVLDAELAAEHALDLAGLLDEQCPQIAVVLVTDQGPELSLAAMRVGVRDLLHPTADLADIRGVLDRAAVAAQTRTQVGAPAVMGSAPAATGRVISVVSPKGGVGKTTVATNLAVGLARSAPNSTVLVDLDVQFGDVATALDLAPEFSLIDAAHGPATRDSMVLKTFLTLHETGLYVICGPDSPAAADTITGEDVSRLLQMLALEFRYVVVDTAPGLSEHTLAALDNTTDHILLTSMDVPGVRGLRKELDTLTELGMLTPARHVVINFADNRGGLSVADVEATIGTKVDVQLPVSPAVRIAMNKGIPLLQSGGRGSVTKQLRLLVDRVTADHPHPAGFGPEPRLPRHRGGRGNAR
ncbi:pilus assembly protein CpaE [Georgenia soli]|uniref:Pilus assembly protein CpaE n=1 Tax=Georgenia soli TaxID=638953 RepID=A0A2A9EHC3_9MICO|nr:AAA family ATPase [Georgenia soli]PFG38243.1 pilus assembly protein CpaE [Georgenia soli]